MWGPSYRGASGASFLMSKALSSLRLKSVHLFAPHSDYVIKYNRATLKARHFEMIGSVMGAG